MLTSKSTKPKIQNKLKKMKVNKNLIKDLEKATGIKFESVRNSSYITKVHRDFILAYRAVEDITDAECALIFNTSRQAEHQRNKCKFNKKHSKIIYKHRARKKYLGFIELSELIKTD